MVDRAPIRLAVPGDLRYRDVAIRTVAAACRLVGSSDQTSLPPPSEELDLRRRFDAEVVSAFSEIFNNIAIHGYEGRGGGDVLIEITPTDVSLIVSIRDEGHAFDIDEVPTPELERLPEGGMGIHIARSCVDELDYTPGPPNIWRLTKHLTPSNVLEHQA